MHAWLHSPSKVGDETPPELRDFAPWTDFFSRQVLVGCDFNMAGGLEGMSNTLTVDASGNQKNSCKLEIKT